MTFENLSCFGEDCAEKRCGLVNATTLFNSEQELGQKHAKLEKEKADEQILFQICNFLNYEREKIISTSLKDGVKELCVARLCQALGLNCAHNFKNEFFNFFSCIMGEVVTNKLGHNLQIDEYNLKYIKVENINLIYSASVMLENPNLDEAFINVYNLANKFKHLIFELKRC